MKRVSTMQEPEDTRLLIRYLLADLNEGEQDRVEERYSFDDSFYFKLLTTEDELIDSYVLGEISQQDRVKFEQVYLTNPHRLKKVESNRILLNLVSSKLAPTPWHQRFVDFLRRSFSGPQLSPKYSFAGLMLVGVLCSLLGWLLWERGRLRDELTQANLQWNQKESEYERQIATLKQTDPKGVQEPPPSLPGKQEVVTGDPGKGGDSVRRWSPIVAFALQRGGVRTPDGEPNALKPLIIKRGVVLVRLTVDLEPNDYPDYRISLQRVGGREFWHRTVKENRRGFSAKKVVLDLSADLFQSRNYILKVTAPDPPGEDQILAFHHLTVVNQNSVRGDIDDAH